MSSDKNSQERSTFRPRESETSQDASSRASFRREPPVVPERVAVLKANYRQAWLYFLMIVCLLVAWAIPIRYALIRALAFRPADVGTGSAQQFVAIAYEGISDIPSEVSPEKFKAQMELLKKQGYQAITLEEVKSFYEKGTPLPDKAILLTFDHSRKSSYFDARRVLQKLGWRAVMFVWTKPILDEDPSALRWPYIRAMIKSGAWEAGAQSHLGFERIVGDSEGGLRNYLTSPRWLVGQDRYESPEEFQNRLEEDHEFVYNRILHETKVAPIAFAFPYGDFGQYDERALLTRRLNMELVDKYYDLAFIHGNAALNTRYTDPLRLNRLLVNPEWNAEQLLERLEHAWPREEGVYNDIAMKDPLLWQVDWGGFRMNDESVTLNALADNTGSKVWLNGTDLYRDFQGKFKLKIEKGQVGFFLRASKDGESHLYLGLGEKGEVWLRQKHEGMEPFTLGTSRYLQSPDGSIDLEIYLRDNQFFASSGGERVFDEIILTRGEALPGILGVSVWDPEISRASFDILEMNVQPFYNRMVTWTAMASGRPYLAGWMGKYGYRFTHLAPPWLQFGEQGKTEQVGWDPNFYKELASVYNMKFTPEVIVERIENTEMMVAENLAVRAAEAGADGLYCNLSRLRGVSNLSRITAWIQNVSQALEKEKIQLIVSLPPGLSRENTINSLLKGLDNIKVASTEENFRELEAYKITNQRLVTWNHVNLEAADYPFFTQLSGSDATDQLWSSEVRSRVLWEQGFDAFNAGDFDEAIAYWSKWSEVEPYNEKPMRLIGDVYQRKQDYLNAINYYEKSLDLNPGQVDLVIITSTLLEKFAGKQDDAAKMLSLYHRLFPENSEIALSQAGMLLRQGKTGDAGVRIAEVVKQNPDDLTALALLHPLLQSSKKRTENIEKIYALGSRLGMKEHFANTLNGFNLLIWPESWRLMGLVEERATGEDPSARFYKPLVPRTTVVRENFKMGVASDNWINETALREQENEDTLYLSATPTSTEASLILKNSEGLRNGFIEATLKEARGFFWLYARRSEGNMIRFGFEPNGRLYLQVWQKGDIVTNVSREWEQPSTSINLKLEVRGDAVYGFIDGRPAFGAPTQIPEDMNLGWWGMAPWAPQFGVAQAVVTELAGGPLPVNIALYRGNMGEDIDNILVNKVKTNTHTLSLFSPNWFFQDVTGEIRSQAEAELPSLRLLTRYYKIRLYPLVKSASARTLNVQSLVELAKVNKVPGFVLEFTRMPDAAWFSQAEEQLVGTGVGLLAIRFDAADRIVELREIGTASQLFAGARNIHRIPLVDLSLEEVPQVPYRQSAAPAASSQAGESVDGESLEAPEKAAGAPVEPSVLLPAALDTIYIF
jgi:tetratricopeptide (TPR) repeat protein